MLTLSSRLYFLFLLVISTLEPMQYATDVIPPDASELNGQFTRLLNYKTKSWDACMILIITWIIGGYTINQVSENILCLCLLTCTFSSNSHW